MMQRVDYPDTAKGRLHNFSAGPAALPEAVLLEVKEELPVYRGAGASILEISHRSPEYDEVNASAEARLRRLLGLTEKWHVLFLQGGASMQFHQVPLNFLPKEGTADYLLTGTWAKNAYKEAKILGNPSVAATSEETNFDRIPERALWKLNPEAAYLHFTSNNTIFGTQFRREPEAAVPLVCDASSDFLSRPIELDRYGLIYAGAQKNIGPAGVTAVLIEDGFLQRRNQSLPKILDYGTHVGTLYNTPPVFAVYIVEKVLRWLEALGGLEAMSRINREKAQKLYAAIDEGGFYRGTAQRDARSEMNVCYRLPSEELEKRFLKEAEAAGLVGLKGHRSVGGIRASIYNACPAASVDALIDFMKDFQRKNG